MDTFLERQELTQEEMESLCRQDSESNSISGRKAQDQMVSLLNSASFRPEFMSVPPKLSQQKCKRKHFLSCSMKLGLP